MVHVNVEPLRTHKIMVPTISPTLITNNSHSMIPRAKHPEKLLVVISDPDPYHKPHKYESVE